MFKAGILISDYFNVTFNSMFQFFDSGLSTDVNINNSSAVQNGCVCDSLHYIILC